MFDRFNRELQMFIGGFLMGLLACFAPWATSLYWFYAIMFLLYITIGYFDSCGDIYPIKVWSGHRFQGPIVQRFFMLYSLGTFIGPLIVRQFLVPLPYSNDNSSRFVGNYTMQNNISDLDWSYISHEVNITSLSNSSVSMNNISRCWYPYKILGSVMCIVSVSFLLAFFLLRGVPKAGENTKLKKTTSTHKASRIFYFIFLTFQGLIVYFLQYTVVVPAGLLSTFVIRGLLWDVQYGPTASAVYSAAQTLGRLLA
jgi:hypothetical protein